MPNLITHTLFADEILPTLPDWLQARRRLIEVGSNGPDILFFSGLDPKGGFQAGCLNKLGSLLHAGSVNDFYESALQSIAACTSPVVKRDMIAYTCGFLCHWALDSTVHPYVFYRTGLCKGQGAARHHRLESIMDAIMLKVKTGKTLQDFYTPDLCDFSLHEKKAAVKVLHPILEIIGETTIAPHEIADCFDSWKYMQNVFYDPKGTKSRWLKRLEKVIKKENKFSGYLVPEYPVDNYDVMNLKHAKWEHPCGLFTSTDSVFDLYNQALEKAKTAIDLFLQAVQDPARTQALLEYLDDDSYNLGMHKPLDMQYFQIDEFI